MLTNVCNDVDWQYWLDSAKQLEVDHPTTARQLTPDELSCIKKRKSEEPLNHVRTTHHSLLVRFTSEIMIYTHVLNRPGVVGDTVHLISHDKG
ncbi:hypothetical protein [Candidatus Vondammii sp. HM_W22]|uniref:hypothetical protein n=1 Tax=Candidatus Vondammii sp. HM_W22 TaxID=2687299 RepID=UPI001F148223|nr:hypothetical protein [Candidatus Vondammii sp. HM_W22]